jgi:hypothetical protein
MYTSWQELLGVCGGGGGATQTYLDLVLLTNSGG